MNLPDIILALSNLKEWRHWRKVKRGLKPPDFSMGPGYFPYIPTPAARFYSHMAGDPITKPTIVEMNMRSGRKAVCELIEVRFYRDPSDMVEWSTWSIINYIGHKPMAECSFREFIDIYTKPR